MLLFIAKEHRLQNLWKNFNTSHVTVYPIASVATVVSPNISIHLMLLFIRESGMSLSLILLFQYISCYCLSLRLCLCSFFLCISIHLMLLFILWTAFPSSFLLIFQYISCYCLSSRTKSLFTRCINFNTSHVTVYLSRSFFHCLRISNFNTSHVTVYLTS